MKKINFGIIGTGRIAKQFLDEVGKIEQIEVIGISARNFEKTKEVAKEYNIKTPYKTSEEMLKDENIDAIYIATMHPTHFPYTIKALKANKNVLCEKPAVLKLEQLLEVEKLAKEKNKLFMEAVTVGFNPLYQKLKKILPEIGKITHVESSFGSKSTKAHKHNPKQGGGALLDIGIYNLYLMTDILGIPEEILAYSRSNKWDVEGSITGMAKYKGEVTGSFYCTMDSISGSSAKIIGTDGMVELSESWTTLDKFTLKKLGEKPQEFKQEDTLWLSYEIKSFIQTILDGKIENEIMDYNASKKLHKTMDLVKTKLGFSYEGLEVEIN